MFWAGHHWAGGGGRAAGGRRQDDHWCLTQMRASLARAEEWGATDLINPKKHDKPIQVRAALLVSASTDILVPVDDCCYR